MPAPFYLLGLNEKDKRSTSGFTDRHHSEKAFRNVLKGRRQWRQASIAQTNFELPNKDGDRTIPVHSDSSLANNWKWLPASYLYSFPSWLLAMLLFSPKILPRSNHEVQMPFLSRPLFTQHRKSLNLPLLHWIWWKLQWNWKMSLSL